MGDYHRYLAEFFTGDKREESTDKSLKVYSVQGYAGRRYHSAYRTPLSLSFPYPFHPSRSPSPSRTQLLRILLRHPQHPDRASLSLSSPLPIPSVPFSVSVSHFSIFYYEILNTVTVPYHLSKQAFDDAITDLDTLWEESYKDSPRSLCSCSTTARPSGPRTYRSWVSSIDLDWVSETRSGVLVKSYFVSFVVMSYSSIIHHRILHPHHTRTYHVSFLRSFNLLSHVLIVVVSNGVILIAIPRGHVYMKGFGTRFFKTLQCICRSTQAATTLRIWRRGSLDSQKRSCACSCAPSNRHSAPIPTLGCAFADC